MGEDRLREIHDMLRDEAARVRTMQTYFNGSAVIKGLDVRAMRLDAHRGEVQVQMDLSRRFELGYKQ